VSDFTLRLDLRGKDEESVERGDNVTLGWHLAELIDVYDDAKSNTVLKFKVLAGECEGLVSNYWLPDPDCVEEDKRKRAEHRVMLIAKRLGLLEPADYGQAEIEKSWLDALHTQVFLHVTKAKDSSFVGIAYDGIFPLDHDKLPKEFPEGLRQYCRPKADVVAVGPAQGPKDQPAATAAAPAEDEFADL
jgi:hypothetical protein